MMIALATSQDWPHLHPEEQPLVDLLKQREIDARPVVWNDPSIDWRSFAAVVIRSTWDYHLMVDDFSYWLDRLEGTEVKVWNSHPLVRMSLDKRYLANIARAGIATVPSIFVSRDEPSEVGEFFDDLCCTEAVIKPTVAASGFRTLRVSKRDQQQATRTYRELLSYGDVMVQPYLPNVKEAGEWSLIYLGGRFSHAVIKRPARDDFRVQEEYGGTTRAAEPPRAVREVAERVVDWLGEPTLYARIDGFSDREHGMLVSEVELVEPLLFLEHRPGGVETFADAIACKVSTSA
jgi:glutathione synthase/RimK-type ligase-like ATP-grasp enzyme